jgi:hypothetical protein
MSAKAGPWRWRARSLGPSVFSPITSATPAPRETGPLFRFPERAGPPDFKKILLSAALLFDFDVHRTRTERNDQTGDNCSRPGRQQGTAVQLSALRLQWCASFPCRTRHTRNEYPQDALQPACVLLLPLADHNTVVCATPRAKVGIRLSARAARLAAPLLRIGRSGSPGQRTCGQGEERACALSWASCTWGTRAHERLSETWASPSGLPSASLCASELQPIRPSASPQTSAGSARM